MAKKKVTLYLDVELYTELQKLVRVVPGASASGLFNDMMRDLIPMLRSLLSLAAEGDRDALADLMRRLLGDQMISLASDGLGAIQTIKEKPESAKGNADT